MDNRTHERLITEHQAFVVSIAKKYVGKGLELQDLVNEGNLGLIRAADKYDETRGYSFPSYAVWWIKQAIETAIAEQGRVVSMPRKEVSKINRVNHIRAMFEQDNERRPNINEIADKANIPELDVKKIMSKAHSRSVSVDAPFSGSNPTTLLDMMQSDNDGEISERNILLDKVRDDIDNTLSMLSERERKVIKAFYGIGQESMTFAEIASEMNITRERARQIRKKALRHMRSRAESDMMRQFIR